MIDLEKNKDIVISRFGVDFILANKNHFTYNCPFCEKRRGKKDTNHKLYVSYEKMKFYCFKCHASGRLSVASSDSTYGVYSKVLALSEFHSDEEESDDNMFYIPNISVPSSGMAYEYLIDRGFTDFHIKFYNMRLGTGRFFGRIIIPNTIYGDTGIWTDMFSARSYLGQTPKYLNPEGCKKTNSVFNIDNIMKGGDIYVNEGVLTSIAAGQDSVGMYGCHPSDEQIKRIISKNPKNVFCTLDGDEAGTKPNEELAETLSKQLDSGNVYLVYMPKSEDAADMGEKIYKEYVNDNKILYNGSRYSSVVSYFKKKGQEER